MIEADTRELISRRRSPRRSLVALHIAHCGRGDHPGCVKVERADSKHLQAWAEMRAALWPDASIEEHRVEVERLLDPRLGGAAFVAADNGPHIVGFAEASRRRDYVNGCDTSPVAFLEGVYVGPDHRRKGVAGLLLLAVAAWGRSLGCTELASDTDYANCEAQAFHTALGFEETERVVFFRKILR